MLYARDLLGNVRISGDSASGKPLFSGIGPADEVASYLADVGYDEVRDIEVSPFAVEYETHTGGGTDGTTDGANVLGRIRQRGPEPDSRCRDSRPGTGRSSS